jgi:hypothetical protein
MGTKTDFHPAGPGSVRSSATGKLFRRLMLPHTGHVLPVLRLSTKPIPTAGVWAIVRILLEHGRALNPEIGTKLMLTALAPSRPVGRPQRWTPLLVAMDGVCRLRGGSRPRGKQSRDRRRQITRSEVILDLARDWAKSEDSIKQYMKDSSAPQHYYRRARHYISVFRRAGCTWENIGRAVAEHRVLNRAPSPPPGTPTYTFNLNLFVPLVHQSSKPVRPKTTGRRGGVSRRPKVRSRRDYGSIAEHLAPVRAAAERARDKKLRRRDK